ncbi:MAG: hypothetical protein ACM3SW_14065 [Actinomycetota bacterium]
MLSPDLQSGAMMIREGFLLPDRADIESQSYSRTWRTMLGMNSWIAGQKLREAGLHLFFIAGELKVTQVGSGRWAVGRAMRRVLALGRKSDFNCMEIAQLSIAHFLGVPYVKISAYSFHLQSGPVLGRRVQRRSEQEYSDWARG